MTAVILAAIGVIGVVVPTVLGYLAGPSRHLRRLEATHELVQQVREHHHENTVVAMIALEQAFEIDAVRYRHRLRGTTSRRLEWIKIATALWLGGMVAAQLVLNRKDLHGATGYAALLIAIVVSGPAAWLLASGATTLVIGEDHRADQDYRTFDETRNKTVEEILRRVKEESAPPTPDEDDQLKGPSPN